MLQLVIDLCFRKHRNEYWIGWIGDEM